MSELKRPPLGIMPRFIWLEHRLQDLHEAMKRYVEADKRIPSEWMAEVRFINEELRDRKPGDKFKEQ